MTLATRLQAFATQVGTDIKALITAIGSLSALATTDKTSIVAALNELHSDLEELSTGAAGIDDNAGDGDIDKTYSADKILDLILEAKNQVKNDLVDGASSALDTLQELAAALGNNPDFATEISTALANRVRYDDVQTLTGTQQTQARSNIGAASAADVSALTTAVGDTDQDLVAAYNLAKA